MIVTKTQLVRLCPNQVMTKQLDALCDCDYRQYCWNQGLAMWNDMYEANTINPVDNPKPKRVVNFGKRISIDSCFKPWGYVEYGKRLTNFDIMSYCLLSAN